MRRQGPLTIRHLLIAALVVVLVNAQLCWWVVYVLRENRQRLEMERADLIGAADHMSRRVLLELTRASGELAGSLAAGTVVGDAPPPSPFVTWTVAAECEAGWSDDGSSLTYGAPTLAGCVVAATSAGFRAAILEAPDGVEVAAAPESAEIAPGRPSYFFLPKPFDGLVSRPSDSGWDELLSGYTRRIKMMVSEAAFFGVLLLVVVGLLWKTVRREVELERQHRNFLSAITHELKSPLASMRLSLETVLRGRAEGSASLQFLENALQDTERLQSLVQKVLEVTRFSGEAGSVTPQRKCLSEVVENVLAMFGRRATVAGAHLDSDIADGVWAEVDEEAFSIVISNLLENAIKYGGNLPRIGVRLTVADGRAMVDVSDNGHGIAEEEVPFVFNRFFRGGDEMTRTAQGTGLGLYLVRQILSAHGGAAEVLRTGPEGTTFRVSLPRAAVWENEA